MQLLPSYGVGEAETVETVEELVGNGDGELLGEEFIDTLKGKMVFITLGSRGSECHYINKVYKADSIFVNPVDTTGAGDAFMGAMLYMLDTHKDMDLEHAMEIANQYAARSTLHLGAIDVLPTF